MTRKEWIIIIVMYATFWAYLALDKYIQKKRFERAINQEESDFNISVGDKIITFAGIYGIVEKIQDEQVLIRIDDNSCMTISKSSILQRLDK